jgi:hypothetical protein
VFTSRILVRRWLFVLTLLFVGCAADTPQRGDELAVDDAAQTDTPRDGGTRAEPDARTIETARLDGGSRVDASPPPNGPSGSCYGRCGAPELLAIDAACACDMACLQRGDCCADKHALCAVSARAPLCTLTGAALDPSLLGTDLGWSFVHEGKLEVLFGDSYDATGRDPYPYDDAQGTLPRERPARVPNRALPEAVDCSGLLTLDKLGDSFAPIRLFEAGRPLSSWLSETPLAGFSDGAHAYLLARRGDNIEDPIYVAVRDSAVAPSEVPARTAYRVGTSYRSRHFQNVSALSVARFDPADPLQHDYEAGGGALFMFGRDHFSGAASRALYLAHQALPLLQPDGSFVFAPSYFAGLDHGVPTFSPDEARAVPVLSDDFERPQQTEVAFVPALGKWVMLYGGDVADWLDATPNDQPRHGAIHMRLADDPWGPWTAAAPALFREHAAAYLHCDAPADPGADQAAGCDLDELPDDPRHSYSSGAWGAGWLDFAGCIDRELSPRQPNFMSGGLVPCLGRQRGNLYAPSLLDSWTADLAGDAGYAHAATLYFLVSTWMPYQVIVAALTVHLP